MIPKFRAWISEADTMTNDLKGIDFENETVVLKKFYWEDGFPVEEEVFEVEIGNAILMQSTGLKDKNGKEIFEGDILKFNDEWADYCYEGYVDGSIEGINYVEAVRGEACFEFGKTRYPESSLFIQMEDEHLTFAELIKSRDFEFEIIGNVWEDGDLIDGKKTSEN